MKYFVYILRTDKNTLYTGYTTDLAARMLKHKLGKGAKYLRRFKNLEMVYSEIVKTKSEALKREAEIKKWSKTKKEALIGDLFLKNSC